MLNGPEYFNRNLWKELSKLGWLSIALPKSYGGQGLSYTALCGVAEELGRVIAPVPMMSSIYLASEAVLAFGSEEQKGTGAPARPRRRETEILLQAPPGGAHSEKSAELPFRSFSR